mmetsp:Transcript_38002/g.106786  ORF Transcript_38002/g.106786 Transcript_38002/m.106786 type:complete len:211 (+) Transcript_38002:400-1032(+)
MHPAPRPEGWLGDPILGLFHQLLVHAPVAVQPSVVELPLHHDVHVGRSLPRMEQVVTCSEELMSYGHVGQPVHGDRGLLDETVQQRVDAHLRHGHLKLELGQELLGEQSHKLDVLPRLLPLLRLPRVLQVLLDAHGQGPWHLVSGQVPLEVPEERRLFRLHAAQLPQGACDATDDVGEAHQSEDHHHHREDALHEVLRLHVHRCRGELCD